MIPVLLHIPGLAAKVFPAQRALVALLKELADEHRRTWDPAQPPRHLTDAFLDEMEKVRGSCQRQGPFGPSSLCPSPPSVHRPGQGEPREQLQRPKPVHGGG